MMRFFIAFLMILNVFVAFGQERKMIDGKVVSSTKRLEGIYVANINTGESFMTKPGGYFRLKAQENDTLMFAGALFLGYRHKLDEIDFKRDVVLIPLEPNSLYYELDEIVITKITAESLGLVPKGTKVRTPAERKIYTATTGSGLISVDAVVNMISGRTKMLKKALAYERQESRKDRFLNIMSDEKLIKDYSIPKDYINGFAYYVATDELMSSYLSVTNPDANKVKSRTGELALYFIELISQKELEVGKQAKLE
ncbi:hypothetical protein LNQ81_03895 [Myroides sp. M-43]|uniref:hypothetical protein n=1 Tax=Myroides oncorhynchi TaxID=2893756 RepID=UPI001E656EAF|nr:hypothetical protein [Myroides oncorhynchi]MCC9041842.1 hypothetical protein [Myroides oncorhynchi]